MNDLEVKLLDKVVERYKDGRMYDPDEDEIIEMHSLEEKLYVQGDMNMPPSFCATQKGRVALAQIKRSERQLKSMGVGI